MTVQASSAAAIFTAEVKRVEAGASVDSAWEGRIERLSALCAAGGASTHIAFLGTSILAKATTAEVDLKAIKPDHAQDNPLAYSARTLSETVLVPLAA